MRPPADRERLDRLLQHVWTGSVERRGDLTWLLTGDIPAMWLRDSAATMRPFVLRAAEDKKVQRTIEGVVRQHWRLIALDPRANAFASTRRWWHRLDRPRPAPGVWERKYELDSLAFPIQLAWQLWRVTGSTAALDEVHSGLPGVLGVWRSEQRHHRSEYRFRRPLGSLARGGRGSSVGPTGMTWSGFRPSDDRARYGYSIPGNLMASHSLAMAAELCEAVWRDLPLAQDCRALASELRDGVLCHGTLPDGSFAYEVDGLGRQLLADDANMPSLLSLPLLAGVPADDPGYLATRARVLSPANPWFASGSAASGIGSEHTPRGRVWPIALAVQGLTATDPTEAQQMADLLAATTAGTGLAHEAFDADHPHRFSRADFAWANAMWAELLMALDGRRLPVGPAIISGP